MGALQDFKDLFNARVTAANVIATAAAGRAQFAANKITLEGLVTAITAAADTNDLRTSSAVQDQEQLVKLYRINEDLKTKRLQWINDLNALQSEVSDPSYETDIGNELIALADPFID